MNYYEAKVSLIIPSALLSSYYYYRHQHDSVLPIKPTFSIVAMPHENRSPSFSLCFSTHGSSLKFSCSVVLCAMTKSDSHTSTMHTRTATTFQYSSLATIYGNESKLLSSSSPSVTGAFGAEVEKTIRYFLRPFVITAQHEAKVGNIFSSQPHKSYPLTLLAKSNYLSLLHPRQSSP